MAKSIQSVLKKFDGINAVEYQPAEPDEEDGGLLPASISLQFAPNALGMHMLEFVVWALGDMSEAGANVRHFLRSPPPWLNTPGSSLSFDVYVYPRSEDLPDKAAIAETNEEIQSMTDFLEQMHREHWPQCTPSP